MATTIFKTAAFGHVKIVRKLDSSKGQNTNTVKLKVGEYEFEGTEWNFPGSPSVDDILFEQAESVCPGITEECFSLKNYRDEGPSLRVWS